MRISKVEALAVRMPLVKPIKQAIANIEHRDCLVVRLVSEDGVEGVGEGVLAPYFTGDTVAAALAIVREHATDLLVGQDAHDVVRLNASVRRVISGNPAARSAIDIALYDLVARTLGVPLYQLLGGRVRDRVPTIVHLSDPDPDANGAQAAEARAEGFELFKLKVGLQPLDVESASVRAIRAAIGPGAGLVLDANQGWTAPEAVRFLDVVADQNVLFCEQPVHRADIHGMAWVQARTGVAIAADEAVYDAADLLTHIRMDAVKGVVAKLIKAGGITGVRRIAELAETAGVGFHLAGMPGETSIAAAAGVHVAAALGSLAFGTGISPHAGSHDLAVEPLRPVDGAFTAPSGPGLGVEIDEAALERLRIDG